MESTEVTVPKLTLDNEAIQQKANEYAMKGAIDCVKEYYTAYNSPFKKKIEESLRSQQLDWKMELPNILALINDSLTREIDLIANTAISQTFVPLVQKFLTKTKKEMMFSDFLKTIIEETDAEYHEISVSVEEHEKYEWLNVLITHEKKEFNITFHEVYATKKLPVKKYQILNLPSDRSSSYGKTMKLSIEGATLEMPFSANILQDNIAMVVGRMILANTHVEMDCEPNENGGVGCGHHFAGTVVGLLGKIFLGLPKGFNRLGVYEGLKPNIYEKFEDSEWKYNKWNIPVWKFLNKDGHTLVRGFMPRLSEPFIHVFLEDCMAKINCLEITQADVEEMD